MLGFMPHNGKIKAALFLLSINGYENSWAQAILEAMNGRDSFEDPQRERGSKLNFSFRSDLDSRILMLIKRYFLSHAPSL
ncbi:hypothetical protein CEXT_115341 [Caerostris extrusa]|uniref:Uncharacterized protein n=1 Tax=Caerostris extrusa TaxID=172846 RepID=A0AAV4PLU6_CAEEX|nr:hypothetical protein CEXT_115341 [Caerostris extrusa]